MKHVSDSLLTRLSSTLDEGLAIAILWHKDGVHFETVTSVPGRVVLPQHLKGSP